MSADRELLVLAAKAAGYAVEWDDHYKQFRISSKHNTSSTFWNPLTDDGDALRLAVKLLLSLHLGEDDIDVVVWETGYCSTEEWRADCCAATRRAIVRAASEIGKAMP